MEECNITNTQERLGVIDKKLLMLREELKHCPSGSIYICHDGKYSKWYHRDGGKAVLIPKKDVTTAQALANKKYINLKIDLYEAEKQMLQTKSEEFETAAKKLEKFYLDSAYQKLICNDLLSSRNFRRPPQSLFSCF